MPAKSQPCKQTFLRPLACCADSSLHEPLVLPFDFLMSNPECPPSVCTLTSQVSCVDLSLLFVLQVVTVIIKFMDKEWLDK